MTSLPLPSPQKMNVLALDTASEYLSVALMKEGVPVASHYAMSGRQSNRTMIGLVEQLLSGAALKPADMHLLVVARGPGSFTGTRLGMALALSFAQVTKVPLVGVDSLHLLAMQTHPGQTGPFHVLLNSAREEVYHAPYQRKTAEKGVAEGEATEGVLNALGEIRLSDMTTLATEIGDTPVVLRRFGQHPPGKSQARSEAFAGLNLLPLARPFPDGLLLLEAGLRLYAANPQGPFAPPEPIYLKSESIRTWKPGQPPKGGAPGEQPGASGSKPQSLPGSNR